MGVQCGGSGFFVCLFFLGGGVKVDVNPNEELNFFVKIQQKKSGVGGGGRVDGGSGWV